MDQGHYNLQITTSEPEVSPKTHSEAVSELAFQKKTSPHYLYPGDLSISDVKGPKRPALETN